MRNEAMSFTRPTLGAVTVEQLRLVATRLRYSLAVQVVFAVLAGVAVAREAKSLPAEVMPALASPVVAVVVLLSIYMATTTWRGEGPSRRSYHWTLPVARGWHSITRAIAGLLLLFAVLLAGAIIPVMAGVLPLGSLLVWPVCVAIVYLLAMIPTLLGDQPDRWILGGIGFYIAGRLLLFVLWGQSWLLEAWDSVVSGRFGLAIALAPHRFPFESWMPAAALWLAIGVCGVGWSAHRHPG